MTKQYTAHDLKTMSPEQIVAAEEAGQCDDLLGRSRYPSTGQLTPQHLGQMTPDEIATAHKQGRLSNILGKG